MSDDAANPVVEPAIKEEISPLAEDTTPKPDVQAEVVVEEPAKETPNPLEPGGDRFKQVWARAKQAEAKAAELEAERQREREERIRLEERLKAQETQKQSAQEYSWEQLEKFIDEGRITRAQAQEYREQLVRKQAKEDAVKELEARQGTQTRESTVMRDIERYKQLVPEAAQPGTQESQKVTSEYNHMVNVLGMPPGNATLLVAARAVLGPLDTLERTINTKRTVTNKEPFMETHTPQSQKTVVKEFSSTLSPERKAHFEKMLRAGVYKDWKEIEEEEKWTPKVVGGVRR